MMRSAPFGQPARSDREQGFTLIELMIAMAVMTVGLLALWSLHSASIEASGRAYRLGICTMLAQDGLEDLLTETWISNDSGTCNADYTVMTTFPAVAADGLDDLPGLVDGNLGQRVNSLGSTVSSLGPTMFLRTYHVQLVGTETDRVLIRVRVSYIDDAGTRHGVTLATTRLQDRYDPNSCGVLSI